MPNKLHFELRSHLLPEHIIYWYIHICTYIHIRYVYSIYICHMYIYIHTYTRLHMWYIICIYSTYFGELRGDDSSGIRLFLVPPLRTGHFICLAIVHHNPISIELCHCIGRSWIERRRLLSGRNQRELRTTQNHYIQSFDNLSEHRHICSTSLILANHY